MTVRRPTPRTPAATTSAGRRITQLDDSTWAVLGPSAPAGHYRILSVHATQSEAFRTLTRRG